MNDLFKGDQPTIDPNKDYYAELVGEGKRYKDAQEFAKSKVEGDLYIQTLVKQKDELRADYEKLLNEHQAGQSIQDRLDQLEKLLTSSEQPPVNREQPPAIDPNQIESLVSTKIMQHEQARVQENNYNQVKAKLTERFGNNYQEQIKQQIDRLGLTEEFANNLARTSPSAFFNTFGLANAPAPQQLFQAPPSSQNRSIVYNPSAEKRDWGYWEKMRLAEPKRYHSREMSVQRHNDAVAQGEAFYPEGHIT